MSQICVFLSLSLPILRINILMVSDIDANLLYQIVEPHSAPSDSHWRVAHKEHVANQAAYHNIKNILNTVHLLTVSYCNVA